MLYQRPITLRNGEAVSQRPILQRGLTYAGTPLNIRGSNHCGVAGEAAELPKESPDDLAPDGEGLAAIVADDANRDKPPRHLTFVRKFFDELRRKVPIR